MLGLHLNLFGYRKDPVLSCVHKSVEKCHFTYTTQFVPVEEEVCEENYAKTCSITYKKVVSEDVVLHCYNPLVRQCGPATGQQTCKVVAALLAGAGSISSDSQQNKANVTM